MSLGSLEIWDAKMGSQPKKVRNHCLRQQPAFVSYFIYWCFIAISTENVLQVKARFCHQITFFPKICLGKRGSFFLIQVCLLYRKYGISSDIKFWFQLRVEFMLTHLLFGPGVCVGQQPWGGHSCSLLRADF